MNDANKVQYIIELLTRIEKQGEAAKEIKSVDDASKKAGKSLDDLKRNVGAVVVAFGGYLLVRAMVKEVEEADRVNTRLNVTLRNQSQTVRVTKEGVDDLAESFAKTTTTAASTTKAIAAQLIAFGATKQQLPELISLILDMAAAGESLEAVTSAIGGGLNGQFGGLSRLLKVGFDSSNSDAQNFADALSLIRERYKGVAQEFAKTPTGQLKQLQNQANDLKEELGRGFLQGVQPMTSAVAEVLKKINETTSSTKELRTVSASAFSAMTAGAVGFNFALAAIKVNSELTKANISTIAGSKVGAGAAGLVGAVGIIASTYELFKMGQAKGQQLDAEAADRRMLEARKNAIIVLAEEMKRTGEVTGAVVDQIHDSIFKAFNTQDIELWRKSLDAATKTLRPDLQLGLSALDSERKQRATLEQIQATKELDDLVLKLDADRQRGTRQAVEEASLAHREQLRQIDELAAKSKASAEDTAQAKALAEEGFQARLNDIYAPGTLAKLEDRITIAAKKSSEERTTQIEKEFQLRVALYDQLLKKEGGLRSGGVLGGVTLDQHTELVRAARQRRAEEFASQSGVMNSERDSLTLGEGEQYERQMQRRIASVRAYYDGVIALARENNEETALLEEQKVQHMEALQKRQTYSAKLLYDGLKNLEESAIQGVASGITTAFDEMISGTKSAQQAWEDFGRAFLKMIADIILQLIITIALKAALKALGFADGGVALGGGGVSGGVDTPSNVPSNARMAASGVAGVDEVSSPTYLRKFNVLAGEAGREMLTVLSHPRSFDRDGLRGIEGMAQGRRLMIMPAEQVEGRLQRAASGYVSGGSSSFGAPGSSAANGDGHLVIELRHSEQAEARIVSNSVQRAKVEVIRDVGRDTPLRKAVGSVGR